jgi:hypothetical protein
MKIQIRQAFVPTPPCQNDISIMDFFITQRTNCTTLKIINWCRIYLKVIFLSDICSADRPTNTAWCVWATALKALKTNGQLNKPLGEWHSASHQICQCYFCPSSQHIFRKKSAKEWVKYSPVHRTVLYNTRLSGQLWYSLAASSSSQPPPITSLPASISIDPLYDTNLFQATYSATHHVQQPHEPPSTMHQLRESNEPHPY